LKFSICRNKIAWCTWHCKPCKRRWLWSGQDQTWHQHWRKACRMKDKSATHRINGNFEIFDDFAAATLGTKISSPSHGWLGNSHVRRIRREKTQRMLIRSKNHPESILNPVVWPSFYLFVFVCICLNLWLEVFIYLLCRHEEPIGHTPRPSCSSFSRLSRRGTCEPRWRGGTERTSGFSWYSAVDLVAICDAHCFVKSFGIFTCLTCRGVHAHCLPLFATVWISRPWCHQQSSPPNATISRPSFRAQISHLTNSTVDHCGSLWIRLVCLLSLLGLYCLPLLMDKQLGGKMESCKPLWGMISLQLAKKKFSDWLVDLAGTPTFFSSV